MRVIRFFLGIVSVVIYSHLSLDVGWLINIGGK